jgi:hypothetical protein
LSAKDAKDMPKIIAAKISKLLRELALRLELEGGKPVLGTGI